MNALFPLCLLFLLGATVPCTTATPSYLPGENDLNDLLSKHRDIQAKLKAAEERSKNSDVRHDYPVPVMIAMEGYPVETHEVITEDCYILEMHRIPFGKNSPPVEGVKKPAVYLQHGLLCSSADWVMGIPEKSLGYILADAGYDVWLGNYRGNTYGRKHCDLNPSNNDFWKFSWDQHGEYDISAMIDHILIVTQHEKIHYAGHSMGTTGFMVLMNKRPSYANKIVMANLLAPVAFMDHMQSPMRLLVPFLDSIEWIAEHMGLGEFLPSSWLMDFLAELVCDNWLLDGVCSSIMFLLCGFDQAQVNETLLETIVHHTPAGASTFTLIHYGQEVRSQLFHAYDMGKDNDDIYGTPEPPLYLIENVTPPVSLYWSQNDWLADPQDVARIVDLFPNLFDNYEVPYAAWNHLDYLWESTPSPSCTRRSWPTWQRQRPRSHKNF